MKNFKKIMTGIVSAAILTGISANALSFDLISVNDDTAIQSDENSNSETLAAYSSFSGVIKEVLNYVDTNGKEVEDIKYVLTENELGEQARFVVTNDTYLATDNELKEGAKITGFYDALAPVILIYPPQYNAEVIAVDLEQFIKVAKFDENLISDDFDLKLNISDETEIISQDGEVFDGDIKNRSLAVIYDVSTRSIPAQTAPIKVIVLHEKAVPPVYEITDEPSSSTTDSITLSNTNSIIVNGNEIVSPSPYINDNGVSMVHLRSIAEALGYAISWNGELRSVSLNDTINLYIGKDHYTDLNNTTIQLGTAPELIAGNTYVPLEFFEKVAGINASELNGQIVISNN